MKRLSFKRIFWLVAKRIAQGHLVLLGLVALSCLYLTWFNFPVTTLQLYRAGFNPARVQRVQPIVRKEIPDIFIHDLLNAEDGRFYEHYGFDWKAIQRAMELNKQMGYSAYGGSTLTQQLARTLFLTPHKTYFRKYVELIIAVEMDLLLSKDRMIELYLTHAEWGDGVFGVKNASEHYYRKSFKRLSADQRIRLITILASPIKYNPDNFYKNRLLRRRYRNMVRYH